ncbi:MAG: thermonuclease family protein [Gammaproteobacteria bacterium]|nr:thermonuclease family protein [Gammaproteobacteria bacterium]
MPRTGLLPISLMLAACSGAPAADHLPGRVLRVIDGDSLVLELRGAQHRIELHGIDAPELNQPWGGTAAAQLQRRLAGAFVVVTRHAVDRANRTVGSIRVHDRDVALDLLSGGLAWSTVPLPDGATDSRPPHPYTRAERQARDAGRGLWSDAAPIAPWEWRRRRARR